MHGFHPAWFVLGFSRIFTCNQFSLSTTCQKPTYVMKTCGFVPPLQQFVAPIQFRSSPSPVTGRWNQLSGIRKHLFGVRCLCEYHGWNTSFHNHSATSWSGPTVRWWLFFSSGPRGGLLTTLNRCGVSDRGPGCLSVCILLSCWVKRVTNFRIFVFGSLFLH